MMCLVCGGTGWQAPLVVLEMMSGTREAFSYGTCTECSSLQLIDVPDDMGRFYGTGYYSFGDGDVRRLRTRLRGLRDSGHFGGNLAARLAARLVPAELLHDLAQAGVRPSQRIVDVGCGGGHLLDRLAWAGFRHLLGVDPFLAGPMISAAGIVLQQTRFEDLHETWDTVIFRHSLEHVLDPLVTLQHVAAVLAPGGRCIVSIPTPSSRVYAIYGANWVQLDAPRHIFLPSRSGMIRLAGRAGLRLEATIDNGWSFGFWGSELYRADISLTRPNVDPIRHFGAARIRAWEAEASRLNAQREGDAVTFVLRRADEALPQL